MKKKIKKLHRSNEGFSLMELIVTMLVSSIVTAAVAGFLSMGLNYYRRVNTETSLQTESQVAELFLTELLQESQNYKELGSYPTGVSYAVEVTRDGKPYIVAKKGEALLFGEADPAITDDALRIQDVTDKGLEEVFLARYVNKFKVIPGKREDAISVNNGLVNLILEFTADGKAYTGTQTVSLRNTLKN